MLPLVEGSFHPWDPSTIGFHLKVTHPHAGQTQVILLHAGRYKHTLTCCTLSSIYHTVTHTLTHKYLLHTHGLTNRPTLTSHTYTHTYTLPLSHTCNTQSGHVHTPLGAEETNPVFTQPAASVPGPWPGLDTRGYFLNNRSLCLNSTNQVSCLAALNFILSLVFSFFVSNLVGFRGC